METDYFKQTPMSTTTPQPTGLQSTEKTHWRIDATRSQVEFRTPTFWGMMTVKGRFERYDGTLEIQVPRSDHDDAVDEALSQYAWKWKLTSYLKG